MFLKSPSLTNILLPPKNLSNPSLGPITSGAHSVWTLITTGSRPSIFFSLSLRLESKHFEGRYPVSRTEHEAPNVDPPDGWTRKMVHSNIGLQGVLGYRWGKHGRQGQLHWSPLPATIGFSCSTSNWTTKGKVPAFLDGGRKGLNVQEGGNN